MKKIATYIVTFSVLIGCVSAKKRIQKKTSTILSSSFYDNQFTGFLIVNAQNKDTLFDFNSEKYFTPASNTKIFTLFSSLQLLPDSIPALKYIEHNDTLFIEGTGDPTLLHSYFKQNKTINFLKQYKNVALHQNNIKDDKYGSGWAWDDYGYYYQPQKSAMPIYGNVATIFNANGTNVTPTYFKDSVSNLNFNQNRDIDHNNFYYSDKRKDTVEIPFKIHSTLIKTLLEQALGQRITLIPKMPSNQLEVLHSIPSDTVYRRMMHESDNFIAEQLLILASSTLSDTLNSSTTREFILENQLVGLRQLPRWVDGSGLSRYNLFTPESMVTVLSKLYAEIPKDRLFSFFPAGGVTGTLEDWYSGHSEPYIYAKSGSLGNNYCLSGYLLTKSGKTLIFSFMNNHFIQPSSDIKKQMQGVFEEIRDSY